LMSQLADVNIQPSVGMLALYDVLRCCCYWTNVFSLHCFMYVSPCTLWAKKVHHQLPIIACQILTHFHNYFTVTGLRIYCGKVIIKDFTVPKICSTLPCKY